MGGDGITARRVWYARGVRAIPWLCLGLLSCRSTPPAPVPPPLPEASAPHDAAPAVEEGPQRLTVEIVSRFPHDPEAFTQGLEFSDGRLFESTGLYGHSSLREVELATGVVRRRHVVSRDHFAEGLTVFRGRIYQLTYQTHRCFVYDAATFAPVTEFDLPGEGWGLTHDDRALILSDGSDTLRFLDPTDFHLLRRVPVRDRGAPVAMLNELELVDGALYANVWQTDRIVRIDPATGRVTAWVDLALLRRELRLDESEAVLNGIAWEPTSRRLFVTGKLWPTLFEVRLRPAP
jgi:glutamine cyclotransferase